MAETAPTPHSEATPDTSNSNGNKAEIIKPALNIDPIPDHSSFSGRDKKIIILAAATAAFFSPLSANIYIPALNTLAADYNVSYSLINLTVTTYLIFQGIAPSFVGALGDDAGRRPAYLLCFIIYIFANLGLALQRDYAALLVLRMLQSAGSSGTVALASGVVADVITSAERGVYIGFTSVPSILGPSLSPILGGVLAQYAGVSWIFWFLLILAVVYFVPFLLLFPETCRKVVDDGSIPPPRLNHSLLSYLREKRGIRDGTITKEELEKRALMQSKRKLRFPNPLRTLQIVFTKLGGIVLIATGILFVCFYAVSVAIPQQFALRYGYDDLTVSLMYLPLAGGMVLSAFIRGRAIDKNYARHAERLGISLDRKKRQDLSNFPIERARLEIGFPLMIVGVGTVIGFGWSLEANAPVAVPIILLFIMGFALMAGLNSMTILMVDLNRDSAATAQAANNLVRCLLGAAATAVMQLITDAIGIGWTCTVFGLIWVAWTPMLILLMRKGPQWRKEKAEKKKKALAQKEAEKGDVEAGHKDVDEDK